ncbi:MAG: dUTP diphosphatase [Pseudohongiellaceae bacterium]|nr:dUTP diphosphatase [Pseudohongiellaceae bacterium]
MSTLVYEQAKTMLELQSKMNSKVATDWVAQRFPYLRAVTIEAAEAIEHHGWKWWKKQECDMPQLQMEIVDIWHFILSQLLLELDDNVDAAADSLMNSVQHSDDTLKFDGNTYALNKLNLLEKLELLIGVSVANRIEIALFTQIMLDCDMNWTQLYQQYVSKNVLNFFRQDHGYKEGTYRKLWNSKEDNEHLVELMAELDPNNAEFASELYSKLSARYQQTA